MIRARPIALAVAVLLGSGYGLPAQEIASPVPEKLTLAEAKRLALAGNPGIAALLARVKAAEAVVGQVRSVLAPQATVSAGASWLADVSLANGNDNGVPLYQAGGQVTWLLFDGFATRFRVVAATAGRDVSLAEWHDGQRLLAQGVAGTFYACLQATAVERIAEQDAAFNRDLLAEAEKRLTAGSGPRVDVLNFRVRVRTVENELLGVRRDLRTARQVLATLLGLPQGELPANTELVTPAPALSPEMPTAEEALADAFARRPDVQRFHSAIAQLEATVQARRREYLPKLSARTGYAADRLDDLRFNHDRDASSFAGLALTWDIFDGRRRHHAVAEASAQLLAATAARDQLCSEVAAAVRRCLDTVGTAVAQSANQRDIADLAREIRDLVRKEYLAGTAALTRLNEAQTDLVRAEVGLSLVCLRQGQAVEELLAATGSNLPASASE